MKTLSTDHDGSKSSTSATTFAKNANARAKSSTSATTFAKNANKKDRLTTVILEIFLLNLLLLLHHQINKGQDHPNLNAVKKIFLLNLILLLHHQINKGQDHPIFLLNLILLLHHQINKGQDHPNLNAVKKNSPQQTNKESCIFSLFFVKAQSMFSHFASHTSSVPWPYL